MLKAVAVGLCPSSRVAELVIYFVSGGVSCIFR
jgi:hypothetical protein